MEYLTTTNGIKVQTDMVVNLPSPNILYIHVKGMSFADAAKLFSDEKEMWMLKYGNREYCGYKLDAIINEGETIRVNMKKE